MRLLNSSFNLDQFYKKLADSANCTLMLDYDGTLAPFRQERDKAFPYPQVVPVLRKLVDSTRTRIVIVSGRSVDLLKKLLPLHRMPELWGSHGLERLTHDGKYTRIALDATARKTLDEFKRWIEDHNLDKYVEYKPSGLAFHWRGLPENESRKIQDTVSREWLNRPHEVHLELHKFDGGVEIRVEGVSKADAVTGILKDSPANAVLAYCGDDRTDEDAFRALGKQGLNVLVRGEFRETAADLWILPPDELVDFLERWV